MKNLTVILPSNNRPFFSEDQPRYWKNFFDTNYNVN